MPSAGTWATSLGRSSGTSSPGQPDERPYPDIDREFISGGPPSTPPLERVLEAWRAITAAADPWLEGLTSDDLERPRRQRRPRASSAGTVTCSSGSSTTTGITRARTRRSARRWDTRGCRSSWAASTRRRRTGRISSGLSRSPRRPWPRSGRARPRGRPTHRRARGAVPMRTRPGPPSGTERGSSVRLRTTLRVPSGPMRRKANVPSGVGPKRSKSPRCSTGCSRRSRSRSRVRTRSESGSSR